LCACATVRTYEIKMRFAIANALAPLTRNTDDQMAAHRKYWEIIADNLKKAGWSYGYVSAVGSQRRTIWIVDAHRDDGKRFVVRADEKLTAFLELESAIRGCRNVLTSRRDFFRTGNE